MPIDHSVARRATGEVDPVELTSAVQQALQAPTFRPPTLPAVALEVMQLASRPNVQFEEVVSVLQRDPVLAARVLSIAQSALYATRSPVMSLHQAAIRLGLKTLRDLVLEAALNLKVFRVPGYDEIMARLYRHSTAVAHVSRAVCRRTLVNAEYAFLCGLLHDVGFAAALLAIVDRPEWRRLSLETLTPVLDAVHVDASGLLARQWKLPPAIQHLVSHHHDVVVNGRAEQANAALVLAEQLLLGGRRGHAPASRRRGPPVRRHARPAAGGPRRQLARRPRGGAAGAQDGRPRPRRGASGGVRGRLAARVTAGRPTPARAQAGPAPAPGRSRGAARRPSRRPAPSRPA